MWIEALINYVIIVLMVSILDIHSRRKRNWKLHTLRSLLWLPIIIDKFINYFWRILFKRSTGGFKNGKFQMQKDKKIND